LETQSASGSRFIETRLTAIETDCQQRRNGFLFIGNAVQSHFAHQPPPFLAPRGVNGYNRRRETARQLLCA
jgi:hypothetical protein